MQLLLITGFFKIQLIFLSYIRSFGAFLVQFGYSLVCPEVNLLTPYELFGNSGSDR